MMATKRTPLVVLVTAVALTCVALVLFGGRSAAAQSRLWHPLTASEQRALSTGVTHRVIVVLRNQASALPATRAKVGLRDQAMAAAQTGVVADLHQTAATDVKRFQLIDAVSATVSAGEAQRLAADPAVSEVVPDTSVPIPSPTAGVTAAQSAAAGPAAGGTVAGACAPNGRVQLNPEAVEDIHAAEPTALQPSAQGLGYNGSGVTVGFIADGLDTQNPDFIRPDGTPVFTDYQDFSGYGTGGVTDGGEAFLDASSIAAQGRRVYSVNNYTEGTSGCNIRILGVAPGASLVGLNIFGDADYSFLSVFLQAINYAVTTDHVNVLNESLGDNPFPDQPSLDLVDMANEAAVAAGVTVTSSSGDAGSTNTIDSPASDPAVISAGATTTYRAYAQSGIGDTFAPGVNGYLDDNISDLSSGGFDQRAHTVDIVAPGDLNWALCTPRPRLYQACTNFAGKPASIELSGGTSEASPLTAGVAALVIQAYEKSHGGTAPTPAVVKQIIESTATDISAPADQQGPGLLNAYGAVRAAAAYGGGDPGGHALIKSATEFDATDAAGTAETFNETLTNTGATPQTVALSSRQLGPYTSLNSSTVQLADATGNTASVTFTVPSGQARLDGRIAYQGAGPSTDFDASVNMSLISPSGQLAEYNLPQGTGNFSDAEVANPAPGTWTALIYGEPSADGGTVGPVQFNAQSAKWTSFGTLSTPSLTLAAGASKSFTLSVNTPATPGDADGSIVMHSSAVQPGFDATTTVPVTLRSLVATPDPTSTVTGTLTGGNGREPGTGQTAYYEVKIPPGTPELNATVTVPDSADTFYAQLIDPTTGEAASTATSSIPASGASGASLSYQSAAALHVLTPAAGTWTLIVDFYGQVSGTAISQPFNVTLSSEPARVSAPLLPDSPTATLAQGSAQTVNVRVTNSTGSPEAYFVDPRLDQSAAVPLASVTSASVGVPLAAPFNSYPLFVVPTHTTSLTASASAPSPIYFEFGPAFGDPAVISSGAPSDSPTGTFAANPLASGEWDLVPFPQGPDGVTGVAPFTAQTGMVATTAAFDPTVSTPTGDLWAESTAPTALVDPVVVAPGQSTIIPVTITPTGSVGSTVTGALYLDDITAVSGQATINVPVGNITTASDVAEIPYEYTIGPSG
jgi:subtilisin family serine protease